MWISGPRTNNHAESWHATLKQRFHNSPRMKLSAFLQEYQENIHNAQQIRIDQLRSGLPPRDRVAHYVDVDTRLAQAKAHFYDIWQHTEELAHANGTDNVTFLLNAIDGHAAYCGYLIGFPGFPEDMD